MKKGLLPLVGVLLVCCSCSMGGLSEQDAEEINNQFNELVIDTVEKYGITDANISGSLWREDKIGFTTIESAQFEELTGEQAFSLVKELRDVDQLLDLSEYGEDISINYHCTIESSLNTYEYVSEFSNKKHLEYLADYYTGNAYVTYKDGELMYDIFNDPNQW